MRTTVTDLEVKVDAQCERIDQLHEETKDLVQLYRALKAQLGDTQTAFERERKYRDGQLLNISTQLDRLEGKVDSGLDQTFKQFGLMEYQMDELTAQVFPVTWRDRLTMWYYRLRHRGGDDE